MAVMTNQDIARVTHDARQKASRAWYDDSPRGELRDQFKSLLGYQTYAVGMALADERKRLAGQGVKKNNEDRKREMDEAFKRGVDQAGKERDADQR